MLLLILYFYQKGTEGVEENRRAFIELMKKYQDQSSLIKLEFVDVNERPDLTEKYSVTKGNEVYLEYKGRKNQIQKIDEQEITSALVKNHVLSENFVSLMATLLALVGMAFGFNNLAKNNTSPKVFANKFIG